MSVLVVLLFFVFLLSFPASIAGLVKPSLLKFLFRKAPTRKLIIISFVIVVVVSFGLMATIVEADKADFPDNVTSKPTPTEVHQKPSLTPVRAPSATRVPNQNQEQQKKPAPSKNPTPTSQQTNNVLCDTDHANGMDFDACLRLKYPLNVKVSADGNYVYVANLSTTDYKNCSMQTNDGAWEMNLYDNFDVPAGTTASVSWGRMVDGNGNRLNYNNVQPGPIDITCFVGNQMQETQVQSF